MDWYATTKCVVGIKQVRWDTYPDFSEEIYGENIACY